MPNDEKKAWELYRERTLSRLAPLLTDEGFILEDSQPHLEGERYLTRPVGGGRKLLLIGRRVSDGLRAVIKASDEKLGIIEIEHERVCRRVLERISFAYQAFRSPAEILYVRKGGYAILITEFIEQEKPFTERPLQEQFTLALKAFKAQESAHATTYAHVQLIRGTFGEMTVLEYGDTARRYAADIGRLAPEEGLAPLLQEALAILSLEGETIARYCGFLTHWDFTPQNIRVRDGEIYLLDHSALHFGNKYEGWARFINFMELYNPALAAALVGYVRDNRTAEESLSLKRMRVFRLLELIRYYAGWLPRAQGNDRALARARIEFWGKVLRSVLEGKTVAADVIESYKRTRDGLRSEEEKRRQKGLH